MVYMYTFTFLQVLITSNNFMYLDVLCILYIQYMFTAVIVFNFHYLCLHVRACMYYYMYIRHVHIYNVMLYTSIPRDAWFDVIKT